MKTDGGADCPLESTLDVIAGRWKLIILYHLFDGTRRFGVLLRLIGGITQRMLSRQLRELEADGVVARRVYPQVPPKVEYSLTPLGRSLKPVLDAMAAWGVRHDRLVRRIKAGRRRAAAQPNL
jgi:DNA-binding HxlR family transcriptional regulator